MRGLAAKEEIPSSLKDFPVVVRLDVHWGEMDAFAHLNNVAYFRYFETGRIAYFEQMRERQPEAIVTGSGGSVPDGVGPILASTSCRYRAPVTYPDVLFVGVRVADVGRDRYTMHYALASQALDTIAATGDGLVVAFDYRNNKKAPSLPQPWRDAIAALEGQLPSSK